ncbi:MAG: FAD-dependent oxidoreductase, partial [Bacteroidota bacterium]|nr:FAD-dependent oxidoreductase [Bacteroidota bacterium]
MKNIIVIGSGFSSISAATDLAQKGHKVTILEKNLTPGGRARSFSESGFTFDMGPSWYWMPDVFERYFKKYNKSPEDYYQLIRLDPSYKIIFGNDDFIDIPAEIIKLYEIFESLEPGSGNRLNKFLEQAQYKYNVGINNLVYKPGRSIKEYLSIQLLVDLFRLDVLQSFHSHIRKYFTHIKLLQIMEFPVLFLGAVPKNTPALYSLMNYADIKLGTWYPMGGMYKIVEGMVALAQSLGVKFNFDEEVKKNKNH